MDADYGMAVSLWRENLYIIYINHDLVLGQGLCKKRSFDAGTEIGDNYSLFYIWF